MLAFLGFEVAIWLCRVAERLLFGGRLLRATVEGSSEERFSFRSDDPGNRQLPDLNVAVKAVGDACFKLPFNEKTDLP